MIQSTGFCPIFSDTTFWWFFRWTMERRPSNLAVLQVVFVLHRYHFLSTCLVCLFSSFGQQIQQDPNSSVHCPNHFSYLFYDHSNFRWLLAIVSHLSWVNVSLLDRMAFVSLVSWRNFGSIHRKTRKEKFCEGKWISLYINELQNLI